MAEILGCDRETVLRRTERGEIPSLGKLPGRTGSYVYSPADFDRLAS